MAEKRSEPRRDDGQRARGAAFLYRLGTGVAAVLLCSLLAGGLTLAQSQPAAPRAARAHGARAALPSQPGPAVIDFGAVEVGSSTTRAITFTNNSPVSATGISVTVGGAAYSLADDSCTSGGGAVVAVGASCTVSITFAPTADLTATGLLTLTSATVQTATALLTGVGISTTAAPVTCNQPRGLVSFPRAASGGLGGAFDPGAVGTTPSLSPGAASYHTVYGGATLLVSGHHTATVTLKVTANGAVQGAVTVKVVGGAAPVKVALPFKPRKATFASLYVTPGAACGAAQQKLRLYVLPAPAATTRP